MAPSIHDWRRLQAIGSQLCHGGTRHLCCLPEVIVCWPALLSNVASLYRARRAPKRSTAPLVEVLDLSNSSCGAERQPVSRLVRRATAYVCQDFTCKAPTTDPVKLRSLLEESRTYGGASWGVPVEEVPLGSLMGATRARS